MDEHRYHFIPTFNHICTESQHARDRNMNMTSRDRERLSFEVLPQVGAYELNVCADLRLKYMMILGCPLSTPV